MYDGIDYAIDRFIDEQFTQIKKQKHIQSTLWPLSKGDKVRSVRIKKRSKITHR
jgi:hypothetical protein